MPGNLLKQFPGLEKPASSRDSLFSYSTPPTAKLRLLHRQCLALKSSMAQYTVVLSPGVLISPFAFGVIKVGTEGKNCSY